MTALLQSGLNFVVIHPNNDHGAEIVLEEMERLRNVPRFRFIPSMRFEYFLVLLKNSSVIAGNSSAGIREAPSYAVPTVNIGTRQNNRFHSGSIMNVEENSGAILHALDNLPKNLVPINHFGMGNCAPKFLRVLQSAALWNLPTQKLFVHLPEMAARMAT